MPHRFRARPRASAPVPTARSHAAHEAALARVAAVLGDSFAWFLSPIRLQARAEDLRLIQRIGKIDVGLVTIAMVLASLMRSSDSEGRILDGFAIYRQIGGANATKEGFRRAVHRVAPLLLDLLKARLATAATANPVLTGRLAAFTDLLIPDGSVFKLAAALAEGLPGTSTAAALKLHAVYSVRAAGPVDVAFTDGRAPDSQHFMPTQVAGVLYLWDIGYKDYARVQGDGAVVARRARETAAPQNRWRRARALPDQQRRTCSLTAPMARPFSVAVKSKYGAYGKSAYSASGCGAFGRLDGSGKRGKRSGPKLRLQF
jgi:hypothetical protein